MSTLSSATLLMMKKLPSCRCAMAGSAVLRKPLPIAFNGARFEIKFFRATQHLGDADSASPYWWSSCPASTAMPWKRSSSNEHWQARGGGRGSYRLLWHMITAVLCASSGAIL